LDAFDLALTPKEAYSLLSSSEKAVLDKIERIFVKGEKLFRGQFIHSFPAENGVPSSSVY
jgi:hypothetical protein